MQCRSFAGEALERERFGVYVADSMSSGIGFANAKANLESLNRSASLPTTHCILGNLWCDAGDCANMPPVTLW